MGASRGLQGLGRPSGVSTFASPPKRARGAYLALRGARSLYRQLPNCFLVPVPSQPQVLPHSCAWRGERPLLGSPTSGGQEALSRPPAIRRRDPPGSDIPFSPSLGFGFPVPGVATAHFLPRLTGAPARNRHLPTSCSKGLAANRGISPTPAPWSLRSG